MADNFCREVQLVDLKRKKADLDHEIGLAVSVSIYDQLAVQRLKRQRLGLVERIQNIQRMLTPDIIA
ncbi:MAG: hypothetical protein K2P90_00510 [Holosporales bacterium]|nr:hypothetical protein [Holosporales bacterium]